MALMKKIEIKNLVSLDKCGRLILDFNIYDNQLITDLNEIMKPDEEVKVAIKR